MRRDDVVVARPVDVVNKGAGTFTETLVLRFINRALHGLPRSTYREVRRAGELCTLGRTSSQSATRHRINKFATALHPRCFKRCGRSNVLQLAPAWLGRSLTASSSRTPGHCHIRAGLQAAMRSNASDGRRKTPPAPACNLADVTDPSAGGPPGTRGVAARSPNLISLASEPERRLVCDAIWPDGLASSVTGA